MARPEKQPHERRSERITIRLTPDELASIQDQASIASLDRVEYARRLLLGHRVSALPESVKAAKADAADLLIALDKLTGQTKRVGNNVNQLTRAEYRGAHFKQFWRDIGDDLKGHVATLERFMETVGSRL